MYYGGYGPSSTYASYNAIYESVMGTGSGGYDAGYGPGSQYAAYNAIYASAGTGTPAYGGPNYMSKYGLQNASYSPGQYPSQRGGSGSGGGGPAFSSGGGSQPQSTRQQPPNYRLPQSNQTQVLRNQQPGASASNIPGITGPMVNPQNPYTSPYIFPITNQAPGFATGGDAGGVDWVLLGALALGAYALVGMK